MKHKFWLRCCAAVLAAGALTAGSGFAPAARAAQLQLGQDSGMTLDTAELTLELAEGESLPVAYLDVQAPNDYFFLIWSSSDPSVASVDGTGKVTGRAEGAAVITACSERGEKADCTVTVKTGSAAQPVLSESMFTLTITEKIPHPTHKLKLEQDRNSFVYVRKWLSSNPAVATVSSNGTVTAESSGKAVISAVTTAGQVLRCTVTVTSEVGRVTLSKNAMLLQSVGASQKLTAQVAGQTSKKKNPGLTWLSSNPAVARVSADGLVTAVGDGEAMILAITPEGRADACYVAVGAAAWRFRSEEELAETLTLKIKATGGGPCGSPPVLLSEAAARGQKDHGAAGRPDQPLRHAAGCSGQQKQRQHRQQADPCQSTAASAGKRTALSAPHDAASF